MMSEAELQSLLDLLDEYELLGFQPSPSASFAQDIYVARLSSS